MSKTSLSNAEARRIALAAQHFDAATNLRTVRDVAAIVRKLGAVQIDSVNVLVRSHYLPLFSRLGPYSQDLLDRAAYDPDKRQLFEYWGHEASLLPVEMYPLFRWRMDLARRGEGTWGRLKLYATEHQDLVQAVLRQIREQGPLGASELRAAGPAGSPVGHKASGGWWGWSQGKEILEWLFWIGEVTTAKRRNFERLYDLTERTLPADVIATATPEKGEAQRSLMTTAARVLGVATLRDLRDYFRLPTEDAAKRLHELVEAGRLVPVSVEGWKQQAYLHSDARLPRRSEAAALLSPFDSLIWERQRTERLFGFTYRLEIYTPAHKRQHGYYVLPFLLAEQLVGRVDLKSDRARSRLQVRGGSTEEGVSVKKNSKPLAIELQSLAQWLGLERVEVTSRRGELMKALKSELSV
ncbi:winged helix-turn-helix domain-containing protein [Povalibacter sp.]|uniref:winged helix-turn-helix domain-containing protein n=1 Tax=Povalibacter sp. TaxID=1962978 RepID=UPI002F41C854